MSIRDCIDSVKRAGNLTDKQAGELLQRLDSAREAILAERRDADLARQLQRVGRSEAEQAKRDAITARRHAALNIIARDKVDAHIEGLVRQGMNRARAVLSLLEGTNRGVKSGRRSVVATQLAYRADLIGPIFKAISDNRPHLFRMINDKGLSDDVARELHQPTGAGRATVNDDAHFLADLYRDTLERTRRVLNRLGADVGQLDGYMPHVHDDLRVMRTPEDEWIQQTHRLLDIEKTFGAGTTTEQQVAILRDIYRTITTSGLARPTAAGRGEFVGPANMARRMQQHRVLHFQDANAWLAYSKRYGHGDTTTTIMEHITRASRMAGMMEVLGPNPEMMLDSLLEAQRIKINADDTLTSKQRRNQITRLTRKNNPNLGVGAAWNEISGLTLTPADVTAAHISSWIRQWQSISKLGAALISSVQDLVTVTSNMVFRGKPIAQAWGETIEGYVQGRGTGEEQGQISFLLGEGFEGMLSRVISPYVALDSPAGRLSRLTQRFFQLSGLTWWTDTGRAVAARVFAADMGMRSTTGWASLPDRYRHVMEQHGFDQQSWDIMRRAAWTAQNGNRYITPDRIMDIEDDAFRPMLQAEIDEARRRFSVRGRKQGTPPSDTLTPAQQRAFDVWEAARIDRARRELLLQYRGMVADEARGSILGSDDPATRRLTTLGTQPGTLTGEAVRFIMQFKSFPAAFGSRILGRAFYGASAKGAAGMATDYKHLGHLMVLSLIAGFGAMTGKDLIRGYGPRDPREWNTILAAAFQSGALGLYGDFFFGESNRFGNSFLESIAGPTIGTASDLINMSQRALWSGDVSWAQGMHTALANTPYINLWYTRPALDILFLNALKESVSPGYLRRQQRRREDQFQQERILPFTLEDAA